MKLSVFVFALISANMILCFNDMNRMDKIGVSSDNGQNELAVAYSTAATKTDDFYAQNRNNYKSPEMVQHLPRRAKLTDGTQITPETNTGSSFYYDGTKNMRMQAESTSCSAYTGAPQLCVRQENCGWCGGSTKNCIQGDKFGPKQPCQKEYFVYKAPQGWNPDA